MDEVYPDRADAPLTSRPSTCWPRSPGSSERSVTTPWSSWPARRVARWSWCRRSGSSSPPARRSSGWSEAPYGGAGSSRRATGRSLWVSNGPWIRTSPTASGMLVDIAERSLAESAFQDPTTAVQAIDRLHDCLRQLARRAVSRRRVITMTTASCASPPGSWTGMPSCAWPSRRSASVGAGSPQVSRRLRAALEDLREVAPPERRAVLEEQLSLFTASAHASIVQPMDLALALDPDRLGLGVNAGVDHDRDRRQGTTAVRARATRVTATGRLTCRTSRSSSRTRRRRRVPERMTTTAGEPVASRPPRSTRHRSQSAAAPRSAAVRHLWTRMVIVDRLSAQTGTGDETGKVIWAEISGADAGKAAADGVAPRVGCARASGPDG